MMFGGIADTDHDACIRIIHKALDFGINFVDTAEPGTNAGPVGAAYEPPAVTTASLLRRPSAERLAA
jgi:diketogulonate reductase-like aldo/keto reductase